LGYSAKAFGAYIVSTASPSSEAMVRSLGADETVDYRSCDPSLADHLVVNYSEPAVKFDLFLDLNGLDAQTLFAASPKYIKPGGAYLDVAGLGHIQNMRTALTTGRDLFERAIRPTWLGGTKTKYSIVLLSAGKTQKELKEAANLMATGAIKAVIDHVYPFSETIQAYERLISGRSKGKVVVIMD